MLTCTIILCGSVCYYDIATCMMCIYTQPLVSLSSAAVVGTLLNQNNAYVRVDITEVLFPSTVQPGIHTVRQFIIPTSMRCCKRLIPGETYLFTGRFFGQMLFTSGCRDIFYYRYNNQNQLLYSHSSATFAKFHPFCPSKL